MRWSVLLVLAACGKHGASKHDEPSAHDEARGSAAAPSTIALPQLTDALELRAAIGPLNDRALGTPYEIKNWLDDNDRVPPVSPTAPPAELAHAVEALVAWDRPGATFRIGCDRRVEDATFPALGIAVQAALILSSHADDPRVHAALHVAQVLRAPDNSLLTIEIGMSLVERVDRWLSIHHESPTPAFLELRPEADLAARAIHADVRCTIAEAERRLADPDDRAGIAARRKAMRMADVADVATTELLAVRAFCTDSERLLLDAVASDHLGTVANERFHASADQSVSAILNDSLACIAHDLAQSLDQLRGFERDIADYERDIADRNARP